MLRFTASIHAHSTNPHGQLALAATFDDVLAQLSRLPRLFIEPDGSFVWRGTDSDGQPWQLDGNLIDSGDALDYVELKGNCPSERLDDVLRTLGWPQSQLSFQLPRLGMYLAEAKFRQEAATPTGVG
jgi:hypothetical protein